MFLHKHYNGTKTKQICTHPSPSLTITSLNRIGDPSEIVSYDVKAAVKAIVSDI